MVVSQYTRNFASLSYSAEPEDWRSVTLNSSKLSSLSLSLIFIYPEGDSSPASSSTSIRSLFFLAGQAATEVVVLTKQTVEVVTVLVELAVVT